MVSEQNIYIYLQKEKKSKKSKKHHHNESHPDSEEEKSHKKVGSEELRVSDTHVVVL